MTPRPYQPVERQKTVDAGRDRIVQAAAELLESPKAESFSIDAVARRAGVARMTIYNQFESKAGLLEALFDALARHGEFGQMSDIFSEKDPLVALDSFVALFGRFWTRSRLAHKRLRAAAMADAELAAAMEGRNERRRAGVTELVRRMPKSYKAVVPAKELVNVLFALLSFDSFDAIAGEERTPADVTPIMQSLARTIVGADRV